MKMIKNTLLLTLLITTLSSCGTLTSGTTETIRLNSSVENTKVIVNGEDKGVAPVTVELTRCLDHDIIFTKSNYQDEYVQISRKFDNKSLWGNILFLGPIGLMVDELNCASTKFNSKDVMVSLDKN